MGIASRSVGMRLRLIVVKEDQSWQQFQILDWGSWGICGTCSQVSAKNRKSTRSSTFLDPSPLITSVDSSDETEMCRSGNPNFIPYKLSLLSSIMSWIFVALFQFRARQCSYFTIVIGTTAIIVSSVSGEINGDLPGTDEESFGNFIPNRFRPLNKFSGTGNSSSDL